jgi:membrane protein DedA with SNARE-associated domain
MFSIIESILEVIKHYISLLGFWGVGIGMCIESACIPLPSEVVLPLGGLLASEDKITLLEANLAANIGSIIGSLIAYIVGYYGGRPFILKYGKYFFVSEKHFNKADKTFVKYGSAAVFFGRLLPVIRTFISLPAGISRMNLVKFIVYSLIGMIPWNFILIYLGFVLGNNYDTIVKPYYRIFEFTVIGGIIAIILFFVIKYLAGRKKIAGR